MLKEHAEKLTERYVMTTPKFFCGLEGFREASLIMGDVFRHVSKPKEDKERRTMTGSQKKHSLLS